MRWHGGYALGALLLFVVEGLIAAFVHDSVVRPHLGDSLAVILVYLTLRAATRLGLWPATLSAFAIACLIEFGQYCDLLGRTGLGRFPVARIVLGSGFDPGDFIAYAGGAAAILLVERARRQN